ncbi:MAG: hypothetical protein KBD64_00995 [Gammaproteobacteria bacterium]|nr:hypothetical protein [Gammaproteobacteria bacterium]
MNTNKLKTKIAVKIVTIGLVGLTSLISLISLSTSLFGAVPLWDISSTPLFLAKPADPLITLIWDDSGSMLIENSPESQDYANIAFPISFSTSSYYATAQFGTTNNSKLVRDPKQNALFFDPFKTYKPWIKADGTLLPNATFSDLWKSPYKTHPDDKLIVSNTKCKTMDLSTSSKKPCHNYTYCNGFSSCKYGVTTAFTPGNFYYNGKAYSLKNITTNYAANWFYTGSPAITTTSMLANAANWYTYYRDRKNIGKAALSYALQNVPENIKLGFTTFSYAQNNPSSPLIYPHQKFTGTNKQALFDAVFNEDNAGGTPTREALLSVNNYIKNTDSLWYENNVPLSCRRVYNIIITDGVWSNGSINFTKNSDGTAGTTITGTNGRSYTYDPNAATSYKDSYSATLADIAMEFWKTDLRTDLDNNLYAPEENKNQAFWQHIVTNSISLTDDVPTDIPTTWPNVISSSNASQRYMDLWHASLNSKGNYLLSTDFDSAVGALKQFLNDASNLTSTVGYINAGLAVNGYNIDANSKLYKAFFNPITWSGEIRGYDLDTNGNVVVSSTSPWEASKKLPAPASRQMIAMLKSGTSTVTRPFTTAGLTQILPAAQILSPDVINYYRGDRSKEGYQYDTSIQGFRTRSTPLGDFVNSKPVYVGPPSADYTDTSYTSFKTANAARTPMLYAASNGGFLHGLNATTGVELFAITPKLAYDKLAANSVAGVAHTYSIDGTPKAGDVFFNNQWNTILVTPMGAGDEGIFSVNVTNPAGITEVTASTLTGNGFWQFDDTIDPDMGYAYSDVSIARISNTSTTQKWAVIFGNGYNNTNEDSYKSTTGNAVLFVLNPQDGSIIKKIDTGVGKSSDPSGLGRPNGLSSPTVVDYDNDGIADYVYAGDIFGNMWKFDIRSTTPSSWTAVKLFNNNRSPMQSVTSAPDVKKYSNGAGLIVYFGTGKFLGSDDIVGTGKNSIYGVLDDLKTTGITVSQLVEQTISNLSATSRGLSSNPVTWGTQYGWVINLPTNELILNKPRLSQGYLLLSSYVPDPNNTVCVNNQKGYIYTIDPTTGGALLGSAIDINNDGVIDSNDLVNNKAVSGIQINTEYSSSPLVMQINNTNNKLLINTQKGEILSIITARGYADPKQRSWKKVRTTDAERL